MSISPISKSNYTQNITRYQINATLPSRIKLKTQATISIAKSQSNNISDDLLEVSNRLQTIANRKTSNQLLNYKNQC